MKRARDAACTHDDIVSRGRVALALGESCLADEPVLNATLCPTTQAHALRGLGATHPLVVLVPSDVPEAAVETLLRDQRLHGAAEASASSGGATPLGFDVRLHTASPACLLFQFSTFTP